MHLCRIPLFSLVVVLVLVIAAPRASADQILKIHNDSLTSYKPTAKSSIHDVRPLVDQRGVLIDGTGGAMAVGGGSLVPPGGFFGDGCDPNVMIGISERRVSNVDIFTGAFVINDVDLSFPAEVPWVIGRSYNARQKESGGSYFNSGGYQGYNWFQSSQPELVFYNSATDSEDMIYLVYGADRFIEFNRDDAGGTPSTTTFRAVNGAAGAIVIQVNSGAPDLATYYDQNGNQMVFFWIGDDSDIDVDIQGSIWKVIDPAGNVAYVGHETNAATALSSYNATTGAITTAYDSAGRRFTYTYTSNKLTQVKAEINTGSWVEVGKVDYSYYVDADSHGQDNDLKLVTITMPLTDSGVSLPRKKYYWYYEEPYNATTNPGYYHQIQYVIDFEGYRKYDWTQDSNLDDDPLSATEANLKAYASANFGYDTERRIVSAWFNGACGCSGAATGTHTFTYSSNTTGYSDGAGYDTAWKSRTIVRKPDVTYKTASGAIQSWLTQYFDEAGQPLSRVLTDGDPGTGSPNTWATYVRRDETGTESLVTKVYSPASVQTYTHSSGSFTPYASAGRASVITRIGSGDTKGFEDQHKHRTGSGGDAYLDNTLTYTERTLTVGDFTITRPLIASRTVYSDEITTGSSGSRVTSFSYTYHSDTGGNVQRLAIKQITTTNPVVSTANNGSNSATTRKQYFRGDGSTAFVEAEDGVFTYTAYTDGQLTKRVEDAKLPGPGPVQPCHIEPMDEGTRDRP